jgi:GNAT superfamily N-acetyltransferase
MPRLPEAMLRRLLDVDGRHQVAVVAEVDGRCVGIASYLALADEPGAAEVAVTITDRYQGRGIGRLLLDALRPLAVRSGLTGLVYLVDPTNRPALRLLRSLGVELAFRDGLVQGRQRLPGRRCRTPPAVRVRHLANGQVRQVGPPGSAPIRLHTAPGPFLCMGRLTFAGTVPEGPLANRRVARTPRRPTMRHRGTGTAAHGPVWLQPPRGLGHSLGPGPGVFLSSVFLGAGGDVGRMARDSRR